MEERVRVEDLERAKEIMYIIEWNAPWIVLIQILNSKRMMLSGRTAEKTPRIGSTKN